MAKRVTQAYSMGVFSGPLIHARGRSAFIRLIALVVLVVAAGWGFSARFEHHQARIIGQHDVRDASGVLSAAARETIYGLKHQLQTEFGLRIVIALGQSPASADAHTLLILLPHAAGIADAPDTADAATLTLPRLVSKALPDTMPEHLTKTLRTCLKTTPAGDCLADILKAIQNGLRE